MRGATEIISYRGKIGLPFTSVFPTFSIFVPAWSEGNSALEIIRIRSVFASIIRVCSRTTLVSNSFPFPYRICFRQVALTYIHSKFFVLPQHFVHHFESSRAIKPRLRATSVFFWNRCIGRKTLGGPGWFRHSVTVLTGSIFTKCQQRASKVFF